MVVGVVCELWWLCVLVCVCGVWGVWCMECEVCGVECGVCVCV